VKDRCLLQAKQTESSWTILCDAGFEPGFPDDIPRELRTSESDSGMFNWRIQPATSNPWIEDLTNQLPQVLPAIYGSLISCYRFCNFEVGPVMFFANSGQRLFYELSTRIFADKGLYPTLHKNGYLQFGNPHEANYDPVCFAMQRRKNGDAPILQVDHEEIFIRNRIRVVKEIAPSFRFFLEQAISEKFPVV
jgi:hypothetical protein